MSQPAPKRTPAYYPGWELLVFPFDDDMPIQRRGKRKRKAQQIELVNVCHWYGTPFNEVKLSICAQCERAVKIAPFKSNCPRCVRTR